MLSTILERDAAVARLRAERRCGELLAAPNTRAKPGQYQKESPLPTLSELGVTKDQSSQWQQLAEVQKTESEDAVNQSLKGTGTIEIKPHGNDARRTVKRHEQGTTWYRVV